MAIVPVEVSEEVVAADVAMVNEAGVDVTSVTAADADMPTEAEYA